MPVCIDQLVTCLTADPVDTSLILAWSNTFVEIDHEIISTAILLPSSDSKVCARSTGLPLSQACQGKKCG